MTTGKVEHDEPSSAATLVRRTPAKSKPSKDKRAKFDIMARSLAEQGSGGRAIDLRPSGRAPYSVSRGASGVNQFWRLPNRCRRDRGVMKLRVGVVGLGAAWEKRYRTALRA